MQLEHFRPSLKLKKLLKRGIVNACNTLTMGEFTEGKTEFQKVRLEKSV